MRRETMETRRGKLFTESMQGVVKNGVLLDEMPMDRVMVKNTTERDALTDCLPGTIAYLAGGSAAWQLDADNVWQEIQNPTISVIGDAAITITGHTLSITTPEEA